MMEMDPIRVLVVCGPVSTNAKRPGRNKQVIVPHTK